METQYRVLNVGETIKQGDECWDLVNRYWKPATISIGSTYSGQISPVRRKIEPKPKREIQRMWVNQPSSAQAGHQYHGINVLAIPESDSPETMCRAYFLDGDAISMRCPFNWLSTGWH